MIKPTISDIYLEEFKRAPWKIFTGDERWYALIAVEVRNRNNKNQQYIFYLLVCPEICAQKPLKAMPKPDPAYTIIENGEFGMKRAREEAKERVPSIKATTWHEFCEKMRDHFLDLSH